MSETKVHEVGLDAGLMQTRAGWAVLAALVIAGTAILPGVGFATSLAANEAHALGAAPLTGSTLYDSYNWAGYFAQNTSPNVNYTVTKVSGTWVQPAVNCANGKTAIMAMWVGIDGATDGTVEQTGSIGQCAKGVATYYVWWELYPKNSVQPISSITVHAGDTITASVTFVAKSGAFKMTIADGASSFSKTASQSGTAYRADAECIVERPSNGVTLYSLAKFTTASFSACSATINGHTASIQKFGQVGQIDMVNNADTKVIASTSKAGTGGSFTVTWKGYH